MNKLRDYTILIASSLSVMAGASIAPALPEMKENFLYIGNIEFLVKLLLAIPPLFIALFSPIAGILLDKIGRRKVIIASAILFGIAGSSGFYLNNLYFIILSRAILGISVAGIMSGFIALIGDLFKGAELNKFMGLQAAVSSFSGVIYLLLSGLLADIHWNYPFLIHLLAFLILPLIIWKISDKYGSNEINKQKVKIHFNSKLILIYSLAIFSMIIFLMIPTQLPFLLNKIATIKNSTIGIYMAVWIFSSSLISLTYKEFRKKLSFNKLFAISLLIWGLGYITIFLFHDLRAILIGLIFSGIGNGLFIPNIKVLLLHSSDEYSRGRLSGYLSMSLYIGQFISPVIMEPIIKTTNIFSIFIIFASIMLILSIYFLTKKNEYSS